MCFLTRLRSLVNLNYFVVVAVNISVFNIIVMPSWHSVLHDLQVAEARGALELLSSGMLIVANTVEVTDMRVNRGYGKLLVQ